MKQLVLITMMVIPIFGFSQEKTSKQKKKARMTQVNRISAEIGLINGVLNSSFSRNPDEGFNLNYSLSKSYALNYLFNSTQRRGQVFSYSIGAGFETSQYHLRSNSNLIYNDSSTYLIDETDISFSKNAVTIGYLKFPILLKLNKETNRTSYQLSFGVIAGLKIFNTYKQKYSLQDDDFKVKRNGDFNLQPFKLESTLRFGRNNLGVFLNYNLLPLFEKGTHEQLHPFSVGLTYNGF